MMLWKTRSSVEKFHSHHVDTVTVSSLLARLNQKSLGDVGPVEVKNPPLVET